MIGASLRGAPLVARVVPKRRWLQAALVAPLAIAGAASILVRPSNEIAALLAARPSVVLQPYLDRGARPRARKPKPVIPKDQRPWFTSRAKLPSIPPSEPRLLPERPIVFLIGIDSLRAEVLANEKNRATLPTLFRLRDQGTYFTLARSAGSSTAPSIAAIFSSKSYSQLYWTKIPGNKYTIPFPHQDRTPRFPEILSKQGVTTFTADGVGWLLNELTIVKGFQEELALAPNRRYVHSRGILREVEKRLDGPMDQPFFGFFHFLDAHFPYTSHGAKETRYLSYLNALSGVDAGLDHLIQKLQEKGLMERTTLIVFSDHGEAFGEHGLHHHASSLYEELLRVPLLFVLPKGRAQKVDEPVSLMDIAPTILDLMGAPTPGVYMGESLTPFFRGERPKLLRPIVAEGRLKRAIVLRDGFKGHPRLARGVRRGVRSEQGSGGGVEPLRGRGQGDRPAVWHPARVLPGEYVQEEGVQGALSQVVMGATVVRGSWIGSTHEALWKPDSVRAPCGYTIAPKSLRDRRRNSQQHRGIARESTN